jgi:hypothetical protein
MDCLCFALPVAGVMIKLLRSDVKAWGIDRLAGQMCSLIARILAIGNDASQCGRTI